MGFFKNLFNRPQKPGMPVDIADEDFEQLVLASDIPAVVSFYSKSCPHCQVMAGLLNELGPEYAGRVNVYRINAAHNPETSRMYQIRGIPALVFFKNHRPRDKVVGLLALNPLRERFDLLIK